jgi:hypothetical protein
MLINIDNYIRKKIHNTKYGKMKNLEENSIRTIYNFIHDYNITRNGILTTIKTGEINFKEQKGGTIYNIKLKDNKKYYYDVEQITSKNNKQHKICFVNIRDNNINCLCFTFHTKETGITELELNDLNASEDCILCEEKNFKFKIGMSDKISDLEHIVDTGDVLMQIFLELIHNNKEFKHIKTIILSDNSTKKCYGYGIKLKYLKTITDGIPYYAKYGFRPYYNDDLETFRYNREHYTKNILIDKNVLINIFNKLKNEYNKSAYKTYKKHIRQNLNIHNKINPALLLKKMMSIENEKFEDYTITNDDKNGFCEIINMTIKKIFTACGYKDYNVDKWILKVI